MLFTALIGRAQIASSQTINDVRTFEVGAVKPSKNEIITVWMEKRPERKDNSEDAADMRVAYKYSPDNGKTWSSIQVIDAPDTFGIGNPYITCNDKNQVYLACMHIGKDFWSGNISFYEFDFKKKQFSKKATPIQSPDNLLDKPAVVSSGNEIHLVYVAYPKGKKNAVRYQMSTDNGKTWSEPVNVFDASASGYLGPSIALAKDKQPIVSIGAYGAKNIQIAKKAAAATTSFQTPIVVTKVPAEMGAAMTELNRSNDKLILTWQNPHQRNKSFLSYSTDDGVTWSSPYLVTEYGNLVSAVFDKQNNLHLIASDFINDKFAVNYKILDKDYKVLKDDYVLKPVTLNTFQEYLGAYQKLLLYDNEFYAFWINYPTENSLNFSKWQLTK